MPSSRSGKEEGWHSVILAGHSWLGCDEGSRSECSFDRTNQRKWQEGEERRASRATDEVMRVADPSEGSGSAYTA